MSLQMRLSRRSLVHQAGLGALSFSVAGTKMMLTPEEAQARNLPLGVLTAVEIRILEAVGETLLPGAVAAGLVHYIDQQIGGDPADCLLIAKYMSISAPYREFYKDALAALENLAIKIAGKSFADLTADGRTELVRRLTKPMEPVPAWQGAHSPFQTYFILRNDATDVMYGTIAGFERLNIPYMAHIEPGKAW